MTIGVALLGITHPHTSGRAEVFAEFPSGLPPRLVQGAAVNRARTEAES